MSTVARPVMTSHHGLKRQAVAQRLLESVGLEPKWAAIARDWIDADDTPGPLQRAFLGIRDAFPDADGTRAEVAWSTCHGLATLQASGRLRAGAAQARLDLAHAMLTR